jgi:hypothetical protein
VSGRGIFGSQRDRQRRKGRDEVVVVVVVVLVMVREHLPFMRIDLVWTN